MIDLGQLDDVVDFGLALAGLPFGNGLPGNPQQVGELLLRVARLFAQVLKSFRQIHKDHLRTKAYHKAGLHATHSGRRLGNGPLHSGNSGLPMPIRCVQLPLGRGGCSGTGPGQPVPLSEIVYFFGRLSVVARALPLRRRYVMIKLPDQPSGKVYLTGKRSPRPSRGRPGALFSYTEAERYPLREYPRSG